MIATLAKKNFEMAKVKNIRIVNGELQKTFESEVVRSKPELYFLDADHRASAVAFCIDMILKHTPDVKCIVIHDIYWSQDMKLIWDELVQDPRFNLSIDVFQAGLLFPKPLMEKQHFKVRF